LLCWWLNKMRSMDNHHSAAILERHAFSGNCDSPSSILIGTLRRVYALLWQEAPSSKHGRH